MSKAIQRIDGPRAVRKRRRDRADRIFYTLLMILPIAQILIFYFGVNIQSICMAFQRYDVKTNKFIWDVGRNLTLFKIDVANEGFWRMIGNSLSV